MMKPITSYVAAAALAVGGMCFMGCEREETVSTTGPGGTTVTTKTETDRTADEAARDTGDRMENAANKTGNDVENATENAGDKIARAADNAGSKMKDAAQTAGAKIGDAASKTGDALKNAGTNARDAANDATNGTAAPNGTAASPDAEDIRDVLASVVETSVKQGAFDDLVERFVDADRNRIGRNNFAESNMADLDAKSTQFMADWKAKYGEDFDVAHMTVLPESFAMIKEGEIGKGAAGASVDVSANADNGTAKVDVDNRTGVDSPDNASADSNKNDPGRNVATVTIKAAHGMPDLRIPMIHEAPDAWKIDVPDSVDGPKLKANVMKHLTTVSGDKANWPADKTEAYRVVSHHMLAAVLGQE